MRPILTCALLGAVLGSACVPARAADTETDVGLFGAVLAGTHVGSENPQPVSGVVPGALLEFTQHVDRVRLHLEGIPQVSARASGAGSNGTSSASLSLLNAVTLVDLDGPRRIRAGFGFQIVNLQNYNGNNGETNTSRVSTPIYALGSTLPLPRAHFVDLNLMIDPNIRGTVHIFANGKTAEPDKPEYGAEVDYAGAYGWSRGAWTYLVGARGLSYHTRDLRNGQLVDRNTGAGATFEVRYAFGRPK